MVKGLNTRLKKIEKKRRQEDQKAEKLLELVEEGSEEFNNQDKYRISFFDVLMKTVLSHINKIAIIFMYFGAVGRINVSHLCMIIHFNFSPYLNLFDCASLPKNFQNIKHTHYYFLPDHLLI